MSEVPARPVEKHALIPSDQVTGTVVRRPNGDKIGTIYRLMIDKRSGQVAYAVMSFGGFLGLGEDYYPVPWAALKYNVELDAYEADIPEERLKSGPHKAIADDFDWGNRDWNRSIYDHYSIYPYWTM